MLKEIAVIIWFYNPKVGFKLVGFFLSLSDRKIASKYLYGVYIWSVYMECICGIYIWVCVYIYVESICGMNIWGEYIGAYMWYIYGVCVWGMCIGCIYGCVYIYIYGVNVLNSIFAFKL